MDFKNCKRCGNLYKSYGLELCLKCFEVEGEEIKTIQDVLDKNRQASLDELVEKTRLGAKRILRYVKEGHVIVEFSQRSENCVCCGKKAEQGIYCERCSQRTLSEIENEINKVHQEYQKKKQEEKKEKETLEGFLYRVKERKGRFG